MSEVVDGSIFPAAEHPGRSNVFTVVSEASVSGITRKLEAVVDRGAGIEPQILSWRRP